MRERWFSTNAVAFGELGHVRDVGGHVETMLSAVVVKYDDASRCSRNDVAVAGSRSAALQPSFVLNRACYV